MEPASSQLQAARDQQWLVQLDSALKTQGLEAAGRLALQAVAQGVQHPGVLNLAASAHFEDGRFGDALQLLDRAQQLAPNDPKVLNSKSLCLKALGRREEALHAFDTALEMNPNLASAHFNRGLVLEELKYPAAAKSAYERAAALDPNSADALAAIAWLDAQAGDAASARAHAERALFQDPGNVQAQLASASADLQAGQLSAAAAALSTLAERQSAEESDRALALGLLADVYDAEGRTAKAFATYEASNEWLRKVHRPQFENGGLSAIALVNRLIGCFENADRGPWQAASLEPALPNDARVHVFLVGFPRSGTTLLENVLAAHPDVVTLEERNCLDSASSTYLTSQEGIDKLSRICPDEAARERETYWAKVRKFGVEPAGRVFIDKMPLASVALPLIAKLFPNARILFARRDPRDVVLSCFRRRFGMNPAMYQLLTLEGAAAYYDAVMRLSDLYRQILPLPQHDTVYETLVDDFQATVGAACDFIGLEWTDDLVGFAANARSRTINTPSAAQVVRGLNREGQGVWRRYRDEMAPVMPVLQRWVERFGYPAD